MVVLPFELLLLRALSIRHVEDLRLGKRVLDGALDLDKRSSRSDSPGLQGRDHLGLDGRRRQGLLVVEKVLPEAVAIEEAQAAVGDAFTELLSTGRHHIDNQLSIKMYSLLPPPPFLSKKGKGDKTNLICEVEVAGVPEEFKCDVKSMGSAFGKRLAVDQLVKNGRHGFSKLKGLFVLVWVGDG